jgi:hypothetical protein
MSSLLSLRLFDRTAAPEGGCFECFGRMLMPTRSIVRDHGRLWLKQRYGNVIYYYSHSRRLISGYPVFLPSTESALDGQLRPQLCAVSSVF